MQERLCGSHAERLSVPIVDRAGRGHQKDTAGQSKGGGWADASLSFALQALVEKANITSLQNFLCGMKVSCGPCTGRQHDCSTRDKAAQGAQESLHSAPAGRLSPQTQSEPSACLPMLWAQLVHLPTAVQGHKRMQTSCTYLCCRKTIWDSSGSGTMHCPYAVCLARTLTPCFAALKAKGRGRNI